MVNLYDANRQWATRPADERFWNLQEMYDATAGHAQSAEEHTVDVESVTADGEDLGIRLPDGRSARLTNWSFGQMARLAKAPTEFLQRLPAPLAAECINHGLAHREESSDRSQQVLVHRNSNLVARAFTSEAYTRIWNHEIVERLMDLQSAGWKIPPARPATADAPGTREAMPWDVLDDQWGLSIRVGDKIAPAGLYASDHDMFAFMVLENRRIEDGTEGGLSRGAFFSNSEVGGGAFRVKSFYYRHVCGNHIVWGVSTVQEVRLVHVGKADARFVAEMQSVLGKYADQSAAEDERLIGRAKQVLLGKSIDEVQEQVVKVTGVSGRLAREALAAAVVESHEGQDFPPQSVWGMVQGLTRLSQATPFADQRNRVDVAAGALLKLAV